MESAVEQKVNEVPVEEDLELQATRQLMTELSMMKNMIYKSKTVMSSVLLMQLRMSVRGLITKYNNEGLLVGETIQVKLSNHGKNPNIVFVFSEKLDALSKEVIKLLKEKEEKNDKK